MYGPLYQWIATAYYQPGWLNANDTSCTYEQLRTVAYGTMGSLPVMADISGEKTMSGRVGHMTDHVLKLIKWLKS